jgi:F420-dependent oxidoreductase-like protein
MDLDDVCIFTEPQQGASYDDLLAMASHAEHLGFGGFFRSDHFLKMGGVSGLPGPTDSWVTLAGLARDTTTIRLGTLVTSATFRHAGVLAVSVAQVDAMSGGRVELGLGAGWYEQEHDAHGIPFPPLAQRFDVLEDQLAIVTGMWATPAGETFEHTGKAIRVRGCPGLPKPVQQPHPPIIIGGGGPRRTPRLAATYAQEFNLAFCSAAAYAAGQDRLDAACAAAGRDPATLRRSLGLTTAVGVDDAEYERRASAIGRAPDELRQNGAAGTVAQVVDTLGSRRAAARIDRLYVQVLDLHDLDHLDLIAEQVIPQL